jgi:hypothetical protein
MQAVVYLEHTATSVPTAGTLNMPYTMPAAGPSVVAMSVLVAWVSVHDILKAHTRAKAFYDATTVRKGCCDSHRVSAD